jgi:hypothetical protein
MTKGFDKKNIQITVNKDEVNKIIKKYKKIQKYLKSSLYTIKEMDGTEELVNNLIDEIRETPILVEDGTALTIED